MTTAPASTRPLVWTLALPCTVSHGALYYAQPLLAVATEHATGWTCVQTGLAFTAALLVSAVFAPRVGRHIDRRGGRHLLSARDTPDVWGQHRPSPEPSPDAVQDVTTTLP